MRYASIRSMDISNGEGIGVSLFVQGCHFHCENCFNSETWDFKGGKPWTKETEQYFLTLASAPHISRISILGGEPLADENVAEIFSLIEDLKRLYPIKKVWVYTGYTWEQINDTSKIMDDKGISFDGLRYGCAQHADVIVDGLFKNDQKDLKLKWRGSANQRVINVQRSLKENKLILL